MPPRYLFVAVPLLVFASPAAAATLTFNGLIVDACTLTLSSAGAMTATATGDEISSSAPGGSPARALLLTTSNRYRMVIDQPTGFATAPAQSTPDNMRVEYSSTGITLSTRVNGTIPLDLGLGLTTVEVNVAASRSNNAVFPAGVYRSDVVMRCEPR